jgi:peptidoglycan/LPS O-acetylase OafA/YrhL
LAQEFLLTRIIRIVPIYWIFTFLAFVGNYLAGTPVEIQWLFQSLLFSVNLDQRFPILAAGWTLQYEMFFYLIFALTLQFFRKYQLLIIAISLLITVAIKPSANIVLEFILGAVGFQIYKLYTSKKINILIFFFSSSVFIFSIFNTQFDLVKDYRVLYFGIPSFLLVTSIAKLNLPKFSLQTAGNYSYSLYLIHFPLLSILYKVSSYFVHQSTPAWLIILVNVIICNISAFFTWKYIELPATNYLRKKFTKQVSF